ncbi:RyR domain-containing protein [Thermomonospora umbrina]|uniref:RyR domain-containing protein n=1 Tax=Thermomonospora umbrina TaxID=111806 RepID=A0A3D9SXA1_9ACTN|nr:RyR domain-containing protein [Thermomonospora umbrina]
MTAPEDIARVAHEANRAWQHLTGDPAPSPPWEEAADRQRDSAVAGVAQALTGAGPRELHEAWCSRKTAEGWRYGPVKDGAARTHPCLVPYDRLTEAQRRKDLLFAAIVDALTRDAPHPPAPPRSSRASGGSFTTPRTAPRAGSTAQCAGRRWSTPSTAAPSTRRRVRTRTPGRWISSTPSPHSTGSAHPAPTPTPPDPPGAVHDPDALITDMGRETARTPRLGLALPEPRGPQPATPHSRRPRRPGMRRRAATNDPPPTALTPQVPDTCSTGRLVPSPPDPPRPYRAITIALRKMVAA